MINSLSHRITAFALAMLILMVSTGFTIDIHFCQNQIKGISFSGKAKTCHEIKKSAACHKNSDDKSYKKKKDNCCHNENISVEKSEFDAVSLEVSSLPYFELAFQPVSTNTFVFNNSIGFQTSVFVPYKPPLPDKDVLVLYQTFLI
ncbi:hypothetical protein SAMN06298216_3304 [Spirosomataceae bacterium TFI 002]|nr:hypothetical protein SAMN06298216_3304 [Spirosomataceae bacterium TFI 002]